MALCPSVCPSLCLSVCPSVTSRCSTKTAKSRITQTTPHDSPGNLVFWSQRSPRNSTGVTPYEDAECRCDEWVFLKWAWSGSREQFLHRGLKFRHSKSSVYSWYTQLDRQRFVYDTYKTMKATRMRHGWVHMFNTHWSTLTLQLHNFDLFMTCRTSSFCNVAWQLARFQLTQRIARSLGDSWASCYCLGHSKNVYDDDDDDDVDLFISVVSIQHVQMLRTCCRPSNCSITHCTTIRNKSK